MSDNGRYGGAHLLIAFVAGAAAGVAVALLTAPQTGRETRAQVRGWAEDLGTKTARIPGAVKTAYGRAAEAAKSAFTGALADARPDIEES